MKPGTVAVLVHADGTEEIVKNSLPTEDGIQLTVNGGATVKIVDNSKGFIDTQDHWAKDAIDFVSAVAGERHERHDLRAQRLHHPRPAVDDSRPPEQRGSEWRRDLVRERSELGQGEGYLRRREPRPAPVTRARW